jgi:peptidoglycan/LPS O-acetylase OafA/YrhL
MFTALATLKYDRYRREDNRAGSITYPLYMYHFVVLVVTSLFSQFTYGVFIGGMMASILRF